MKPYAIPNDCLDKAEMLCYYNSKSEEKYSRDDDGCHALLYKGEDACWDTIFVSTGVFL